jgi:hypothetical protein
MGTGAGCNAYSAYRGKITPVQNPFKQLNGALKDQQPVLNQTHAG